jgi:copper chaperone CopZ
MSYYLHNVPGRLRVKTPQVKGNEARAEEVRRMLLTIEGVSDVCINTVTGSILVKYDSDRANHRELLEALREGKIFDSSKAVTNDQYIYAASLKAGGILKKALVGTLVDKALEGSAFSLLAALI